MTSISYFEKKKFKKSVKKIIKKVSGVQFYCRSFEKLVISLLNVWILVNLYEKFLKTCVKFHIQIRIVWNFIVESIFHNAINE